MKTGIEIITDERLRQKAEGYCLQHDKQHDCHELAFAAAAYALPPFANTKDFKRVYLWPWLSDQWKPSDNRIRELAKAGALIAAEIDRLQSL